MSGRARPETALPLLRPQAGTRRLWRLTILLGLAALLATALLGGTSVWLLGSVALAGLSPLAYTFDFHTPSALIRLFAVARTGTKYGERLLGHKAALLDQVASRVEIFRAMAGAPVARSAGWQLGDQERLATYLDDVEDVDFGSLRADLPLLVAASGLLLGLLATLMIAPLALLPIAVAAGILWFAVRRLEHRAAVTLRRSRGLRGEGDRALGLVLASIVPLKAEGGWRREAGAALRRFDEAGAEHGRLLGAQAVFDSLSGLFGPVAGMSVLVSAWIEGGRGAALLPPAFLAFVWLTLGEAVQGGSRVLVAMLRRRFARESIARWTDGTAPAVLSVAALPALPALDLSGFQRRAPDGRPLGLPLDVTFRAGAPTLVVGASGSGKTSLLKQIAGWLAGDAVLADGQPLTVAQRRSFCRLCLHDAAILADTVRANLFAPDLPDDTLWEALGAVELSARVEAAGGLDAWITQDVLSLGEAQRLNLARVLLAAEPVVLLDEPTEHLDAEQGERVALALARRLADRVLVISTHRALPVPASERLELR